MPKEQSPRPSLSQHTAAFGPGLPNTGRVRCPMQLHPLPRGLRDQLNPNNNNLALNLL
jgi:hypothetical protein